MQGSNILIIEAGSSKADVAIIRNGHIVQRTQTSGMNPVTDSNFDEKLIHLVGQIKNIQEITEAYYYGAGCVNDKINQQLSLKLKSHIPNLVRIEIQDDLFGACRGICGNDKGIVAIIGTGSNIGYYNGSAITDKIRSCGYLLGDEGSGYRLGQSIYTRLSRGLLPTGLHREIINNHDLEDVDLVLHLYAHPSPRSFLSQFAPYVLRLDEKPRNELIVEVFEPWCKQMVIPLMTRHRCNLYCAGSVAFYFKKDISDMLKKFNIIATSFTLSPIDGIVKYHYGKKGY